MDATLPFNKPIDAEDERTKIKSIVSSPNRESPGRDSYISYLITTTSTLPVFTKPEFKVRRRYNDFVFLHATLTQNYPACAIPPLPEASYIKRFDAEFTKLRCQSLNRFLSRCTMHPQLKRASELHTFVESDNWNAYKKRLDGHVIEGLTDTLMGAFKVIKTDKKFTDVRERSDKLARDLTHVEKLVYRIHRRETDLELDFSEMAQHFARLAVIEPELEEEFTNLAKRMNLTAAHLKKLRDSEYLTSIRDQASYNVALKGLLKLRDQKQADFEALTQYQLKTSVERDQLASGVTNFIQSKVENLRGLNTDLVRAEKLKKVEEKVAHLAHETETARTTSEAFDEQVLREVAIFESTKSVETKQAMREFVRANIEFYQSIVYDWEHDLVAQPAV